MRKKPEKPSPNFPLFAHQRGQWAKKMGGTLKYFGVWADHDATYRKYQKQYENPQAVQTSNKPTLDDLLNDFCD